MGWTTKDLLDILASNVCLVVWRLITHSFCCSTAQLTKGLLAAQVVAILSRKVDVLIVKGHSSITGVMMIRLCCMAFQINPCRRCRKANRVGEIKVFFMKFLEFSARAMSTDEMNAVRGGWCYSYSCTCGSSSYNGWGNLAEYQGDAQSHCSAGVPVNCTFGSLPPGTCGIR
jgi:hypothetical protein